MRHDPTDPDWPDRDRFVLSNGHASILLYSMLYLTGYGLTLDDLKDFRPVGSRTPGHPERRHTAGVEVTTGPLGQGVGNGVGMGVAERVLRARFGPELCDHHTFVVCGDGCLEEGISHEAASLAGHLGLGRLVYVYDDNHITIDGPTELAYSDNVPERFEAYGWDVDAIGEVANDTEALEAALRRAMATGGPALPDRAAEPHRLAGPRHRGHQGGPRDPARTRRDPHHQGDPRASARRVVLGSRRGGRLLPALRRPGRDAAGRNGRNASTPRRWTRRPGTASWSGHGFDGWEAKLPTFEAGQSLATRRVVNACINATAPVIPGLLAGSADLTENTGVTLDGAERQSPEHPAGQQLYFGIREHAMGAVMTGMAAHGGILPVGGTFFTFSDYMRPAVRLAALSGAHVIYSWTHDSIGVGEDGPTHEPIEHLASLRAMPGLFVVRPADANECAQAWRCAVEADQPVAMILSRQSIPVLAETAEAAVDGLRRGGYVLRPEEGPADLVLVGTGSEVHLCLGAADALAAQGLSVRVVSLPCWEWFEDQDADYRESVLPSDVPTLSVEAAASFGWDRYADASVSIDTYGASGASQAVLDYFGFTVENVTECAWRSSSGPRSEDAIPGRSERS